MPKQVILSDSERADIVERYQSGESMRDLALAFYVPKNVINRVLKEEGAEMRKRGRAKKMQNTGINEDFEEAVDSMIAENPSAMQSRRK